MTIILAIAILGGIAALLYFWEKCQKERQMARRR